MNPETAAPATRSAATPLLEVSLEDVGPFLRAVGLVFDEISPVRVTAHLELGPKHHTPWGVVHGGVYTTAVETAATVGARLAALDQVHEALGRSHITPSLQSVPDRRGAVHATPLSLS